jgi:acetate kinase
VNDDLLAAMQDFVPVAPVHNPVYIQAMQIFREILPGVPMVAVFETGFHATLPEHAYIYGVPWEWGEKYGVRRYGFHGSSHRYIAQRVPDLLRRSSAGLRLVSCHLGGSSSLCAIQSGLAVDTSMGFSPQAGLEQSSRPGDLDPFVVLHVMEREKLAPREVVQLLCKKSGLLGISGLSNDVRDLEKAAAEGHARARLALQVFVYELKKHLGAYAAALGGLDAVAFAGGIGENSWRIREQVCSGLEFLGLHFDPEANRLPAQGDRVISALDSAIAVLVVHTNEELMVARETVKVLAATRGMT